MLRRLETRATGRRRATAPGRVAMAALLVGLFVALLIGAALHDHLRDRSNVTSGCVYCGGAFVAPRAARGPERGVPLWVRRVAIPREAPVLRSRRRRDHSGGAPPSAT